MGRALFGGHAQFGLRMAWLLLDSLNHRQVPWPVPAAQPQDSRII